MLHTAKGAWKTLAAVVTAALTAGSVMAQESLIPVGQHRDWYVYSVDDSDGKVCWIASAPQRWSARRSGRDVTNSVRRGEIRLMVANHPGDGRSSEVSVVIGYPFQGDRSGRIVIAGDRFDLHTEGELGWTLTPADDTSAIAAMRAGVEATVTGTSGRGTVTTDTYSLLGFTAALEQSETLCQ